MGKKKSVVPSQHDDDDEDIDIEIKKKKGKRKNKKRKSLEDEVPDYMKLSDDDSQMDAALDCERISKRIEQQKFAMMTQQPMESQDEGGNKNESDRVLAEQHIKKLDDCRNDQIDALSTPTLRRLAKYHKISIHI